MSNSEVVQPFMAVYAFDSLICKLSNDSRPALPPMMPAQPYPLFVTWKITRNEQ